MAGWRAGPQRAAGAEQRLLGEQHMDAPVEGEVLDRAAATADDV
ncbi:hypothetical protein [Gordonia defluvii]